MNITIAQYTKKDLDKVRLLITDHTYLKNDIVDDLEQNPKNAYIAKNDDEIMGIITSQSTGDNAYFNLYVPPALRHYGVGSALLDHLEIALKKQGIKKLKCDYQTNDTSTQFCLKHGYKAVFYSNYMTYTGKVFDVDNTNITTYADEDYDRCHEILSEAFHKMRLHVGMESQLAKPSERQRLFFMKHADNIFVLREANRIVAVARLDGDELDAVAVDVHQHGKGYGKKIIKYALNQLIARGYNPIVLWAVEGNPAKHLYEKLGFKAWRLHEFMIKSL